MLTPKPTQGDTSWFVHDRFGMFILRPLAKCETLPSLPEKSPFDTSHPDGGDELQSY